MVIHWERFGIAPAEQVRFVQPHSSSIALNLVMGADPSHILGRLSANGKVFLINPNGILFGQGAQVQVGGLVASTLALAEGDFLRGHFRFSGDSTASVVNQGRIRADGGQVVLLGATVRNTGDIVADLGSVAMAAGKSIAVDFVGDGLLEVAVNEAVVHALIENGGLIQADGGHILLHAHAAGQWLQGAVNNTGVLQAHSVGQRNGRIYLLGGDETAIKVGGTLDASGMDKGQTGGTVHLLGGAVHVEGALVQASGDAGGGTVLVGGDFQGQGALRRAQHTSVDSGTVIQADARTAGDGGQIVVWSDGRTDVGGVLSARGGREAGDGGLIETSGQRVAIAVDTQVQTVAPAGHMGLWLLDPPNYTIAGAGGDETPAQVSTSLAGTNRLIVATNDVVVADALTWSTAQTLTLRAGNDVRINAAVTASTAGSGIVLEAGNDVNVAAAMTASGAGSLIKMTAGRDVTASGIITASANGALIDMTAGRNTSVTVVTANGGGSINLKANTNVVVNGAVGADGGPVSLRADNDGTGPGVAGGTVLFVGPGRVSAPNTTIRFNPASYLNTSAEIAAYVTKVTGALDARAWVFGQGIDKVYDGTLTDTLGFRGTPTQGGDVALVPGTASFDTKNVGTGKTVTFSGYTLAGVDVARFDLFAGNGLTTASITPAPLTVTASNVVKVYGDTPTLSGFTKVGLVNAETIGSVTETSAGQIATASVIGSPYTIVPSAATGGTFAPSNYTITYINGVLTVTPAALTVTASNVLKTYGDIPVLSGFTPVGLVNAETIGSVTGSSAGGLTTASVIGSPYTITPSAATGGTFTPSNYTITYVNGALTVAAAVVPVVPPVVPVVPPVVPVVPPVVPVVPPVVPVVPPVVPVVPPVVPVVPPVVPVVPPVVPVVPPVVPIIVPPVVPIVPPLVPVVWVPFVIPPEFIPEDGPITSIVPLRVQPVIPPPELQTLVIVPNVEQQVPVRSTVPVTPIVPIVPSEPEQPIPLTRPPAPSATAPVPAPAAAPPAPVLHPPKQDRN